LATEATHIFLTLADVGRLLRPEDVDQAENRCDEILNLLAGA
jgi:hypothetical protein